MDKNSTTRRLVRRCSSNSNNHLSDDILQSPTERVRLLLCWYVEFVGPDGLAQLDCTGKRKLAELGAKLAETKIPLGCERLAETFLLETFESLMKMLSPEEISQLEKVLARLTEPLILVDVPSEADGKICHSIQQCIAAEAPEPERAITAESLTVAEKTPSRPAIPSYTKENIATHLALDPPDLANEAAGILQQSQPHKYRSLATDVSSAHSLSMRESLVGESNEAAWVVVAFPDVRSTVEIPLIWEASDRYGLTPSILYGGILQEGGHVVLRGDLLSVEDCNHLTELARSRGAEFFSSVRSFSATRPNKRSAAPILLDYYDKHTLFRLRFPLELVKEPYLHNLAKHYNVRFNVFHANIIGSHGYLDVELHNIRSSYDSERLLSHAVGCGISVSRVTRKTFWNHLKDDCEEEIRRRVAECFNLNSWRRLPRDFEPAIRIIWNALKARYALFPGYYELDPWLVRQVELLCRERAAAQYGSLSTFMQNIRVHVGVAAATFHKTAYKSLENRGASFTNFLENL